MENRIKNPLRRKGADAYVRLETTPTLLTYVCVDVKHKHASEYFVQLYPNHYIRMRKLIFQMDSEIYTKTLAYNRGMVVDLCHSLYYKHTMKLKGTPLSKSDLKLTPKNPADWRSVGLIEPIRRCTLAAFMTKSYATMMKELKPAVASEDIINKHNEKWRIEQSKESVLKGGARF